MERTFPTSHVQANRRWPSYPESVAPSKTLRLSVRVQHRRAPVRRQNDVKADRCSEKSVQICRDLNTEMCLWRINGVYETRAPLLFKALVHTGLRCHVERGGGGGDIQLEAITRVRTFISKDGCMVDSVKSFLTPEFYFN